MRINKYLAERQIASRRHADELVKQRRVTINGKVAMLGADVKEGDKVEVKKDKREIAPLYFVYNKPTDVVSHSPRNGEMNIVKMVKGRTQGAKVFPLGRLDKDSHGLIILTNDGRITGKLLNPEEGHEKEYVVQTKEKIDDKFIESLKRGVVIKEDYSKATYKTKPCEAKILGIKKFSIILTEGKKRQVRRMVTALRNEVRDLERVRIMNIRLKDLPENSLRRIEGAELHVFLKDLGMK
jgi:23S rRNA pseudouridine2604 synthase